MVPVCFFPSLRISRELADKLNVDIAIGVGMIWLHFSTKNSIASLLVKPDRSRNNSKPVLVVMTITMPNQANKSETEVTETMKST